MLDESTSKPRFGLSDVLLGMIYFGLFVSVAARDPTPCLRGRLTFSFAAAVVVVWILLLIGYCRNGLRGALTAQVFLAGAGCVTVAIVYFLFNEQGSTQRVLMVATWLVAMLWMGLWLSFPLALLGLGVRHLAPSAGSMDRFLVGFGRTLSQRIAAAAFLVVLVLICSAYLGWFASRPSNGQVVLDCGAQKRIVLTRIATDSGHRYLAEIKDQDVVLTSFDIAANSLDLNRLFLVDVGAGSLFGVYKNQTTLLFAYDFERLEAYPEDGLTRWRLRLGELDRARVRAPKPGRRGAGPW